MVDTHGKITWFDWEHCCARNRLDDMAWLLCDEIMPYHPDAEERLIQNYLAYFADGSALDQAHAYLRIFGILHMGGRLGGILSEKESNPWMHVGNRQYNLAEDPLVQAQRLCTRAADWAKKSIYPNSIHDWFLKVSARLKEM
jgi:thiamine kinase-like enzyme